MWWETVGWDSGDRGGEVADAGLAVRAGGDQGEQPQAGGLGQRLEDGGEPLGRGEVERLAADRGAAVVVEQEAAGWPASVQRATRIDIRRCVSHSARIDRSR